VEEVDRGQCGLGQPGCGGLVHGGSALVRHDRVLLPPHGAVERQSVSQRAVGHWASVSVR
jgi:hypothetical protein